MDHVDNPSIVHAKPMRPTGETFLIDQAAAISAIGVSSLSIVGISSLTVG